MRDRPDYRTMSPQERRDAGLKFVGSANAWDEQEACSICGGTVAIPTSSHPHVFLVFVETRS